MLNEVEVAWKSLESMTCFKIFAFITPRLLINSSSSSKFYRSKETFANHCIFRSPLLLDRRCSSVRKAKWRWHAHLQMSRLLYVDDCVNDQVYYFMAWNDVFLITEWDDDLGSWLLLLNGFFYWRWWFAHGALQRSTFWHGKVFWLHHWSLTTVETVYVS